MSISFIEAFDYYNPTKEKLPEHLVWRVGHIVQWARWHIKKRPLKEYKAVLKQADQWFRFRGHSNSPRIMRKFKGKYDEAEALYTTQCMMIFHFREDYNLSEIKDIKKLDWSEFFAIIALAKLGMMVTIESKPIIYDPNPKNAIMADLQRDQSGYYRKLKEECLLEAMEAVSYAQAIALEEEKKRKDKARGKAAGDTKRQAYHQLKQYVINRYNETDPSLSDRAVAKQILDGMPDKLKLGFKTDEPENTIKNWFLKYRRGELKDIHPFPPTRV